MKTIFEFSDYRDFLKAYYDHKKKTQPSFSYGVFAKNANFTSTSYLIEIVNRKKALSKNSVLDIANAIGLKKKETEYFETLVDFAHAKTDKKKQFFFTRLKNLRGQAPGSLVGEDQFDFYSKWYHTVIRELVAMSDFKGDVSALSKKVNPKITPKQAKESVELLLRLGFLEKLAGNKFRQASPTIHTDDEVLSYAVVEYQQECMKLGGEALVKLPAAVRDISTITAGLSEDGFKLFKKELQECRKRLAQIASDDNGEDRVYHVNLNLFPMSNLPKKEKLK